MPSNSDTMDRAAKMLGISVDEVSKRLEKLPVDQVIDVLDDITAGREEAVKDALGDGVDENDHTQDDAEEAGEEEHDISPLFMKSAQKSKNKNKNTPSTSRHDEDDEAAHEPNIGDDVRVGDDDGIVKFKNGPGNTTGVMIDGETTMVNDDKIRRAPVSESRIDERALGMTGMPDLARMRELAGMAPPSADYAAVDLAGKMNAPDGPLSPGSFSVEVEPCPEPSCDGEVETVITGGGLAGFGVPLGSKAPPAPAAGGLDAIMGQFDAIEQMLPGIVLGDLKQIRDRINKLNMKLNEGTEGRRRKF